MRSRLTHLMTALPLALCVAAPAVAHAQRPPHVVRSASVHDRPVHVERRIDAAATRTHRSLENELTVLRADARAFGDSTANAHLRRAGDELDYAAAALRSGRDRSAWASLDDAEASLRAADRRLASLRAEIDGLRHEARASINAAQRLTSRIASHDAVRLVISAESAHIDGEGHLIRGDYLEARRAFALAIDRADQARILATRHTTPDRGRGHGRSDGYLPARWDDRGHDDRSYRDDDCDRRYDDRRGYDDRYREDDRRDGRRGERGPW